MSAELEMVQPLVSFTLKDSYYLASVGFSFLKYVLDTSPTHVSRAGRDPRHLLCHFPEGLIEYLWVQHCDYRWKPNLICQSYGLLGQGYFRLRHYRISFKVTVEDFQ
jgi:hypothetical protein